MVMYLLRAVSLSLNMNFVVHYPIPEEKTAVFPKIPYIALKPSPNFLNNLKLKGKFSFNLTT